MRTNSPIGAAETTLRSKRLCHLVVFIVAISGCDWSSSVTRHRGVPVVVDDTLLRYPDNSTLATGLHDAALIGQLPAEGAAPFVIIAGRECSGCDGPPLVIVRAPSRRPARDLDALRGWHSFPGRTVSDDGGPVSYSRLFWGDCLPPRPPAVVSFRTSYPPAGQEPLRELLISEVHGDSLLEWRMVPEVRTLVATLMQVRARRCTEVAPREMFAP